MAKADTKFFDLIIKSLETIYTAEAFIRLGSPPVSVPTVEAERAKLLLLIIQLKAYKLKYSTSFENLQNNLDVILNKLEN